MSQLIVSALGPDRPGIVGELTSHLHEAGANLLDTRMVNLRGQFAMMVLLEAPNAAVEKIASELPQFGRRIGLTLTVAEQGVGEAAPHATHGLPYRLKTYSLDQPGIVARLTGVLRGYRVNIEELTARQESAAFAGNPLFLTEMRLTVPADVSLRELRADIEKVCSQINCDWDLDPAEG
jgi:glycine cleavage system transcriptional repressor